MIHFYITIFIMIDLIVGVQVVSLFCNKDIDKNYSWCHLLVLFT